MTYRSKIYFKYAGNDATESAPKTYKIKSVTLTTGDATGISSVKAAEAADNVYYNLSGQRVAKPSKGLYIQNGKKVLVK